ncbi:hypothetical protein GOBAR_AA10266 [Gossypium barbadense]|uniref:BTB domain-containing protein n=1 Tax=Gossypium barbadense TaxID=3634 RepID=A0A2P5Y455_GOSBA|nr:hypothetical protein GOBAR_AA10266 [Gossypium barbadense]
MVDLDQEDTAPTTLNMSAKKKELMSTAMKRTSEWIFSQEIPSDVTVQVAGVSFSLHKFPLVSKCGYIRKVVSESNDADVSVIVIPDAPGGAESFELAAKFCYGINFEINTENIAALRCVAEYLEMTEDYAVGSLVERTEAFLNEVALQSLAGAISVLHASENLLPIAEEVKLVGRCIDAIAYLACKESGNDIAISSTISNSKTVVDWWAEDLAVLRIDIFQRVLIAMIARGFKPYAFGPVLMLYAQKALRGLEIFGKGRKKIEPRQEHEKRVVLETIVSLLPKEKNAMSVSFLTVLLRAAHPTITDLERKKVCSLMDCQKLSREACAHAAQNDRLPVQTVVQVLYYEQQRLRDVMNGSMSSGTSPSISSRVNLYPPTDIHPVSDELSSLKRENEDLKLELVKMKMRLKEIERPSSAVPSAASSPMGIFVPSSDKPPFPRKSFMNSVSKKLGRLYPFGVPPSGAKARTRPSKDRRHSIS